MPKEFDPEKILDLGKPSGGKAIGATPSEPEEDKIFFPTMSLDMGMIPGEVGKQMFVKMLTIISLICLQ